MKICEIMHPDVETIQCDATIAELERLLRQHRISGLPVVSPDGELMGIVSKTDILSRLDLDGSLARSQKKVWEIMTPDILWVDAQEEVAEVARKMVEARVHRVLVYEAAALRGIVTSFDFMRVVADSLG